MAVPASGGIGQVEPRWFRAPWLVMEGLECTTEPTSVSVRPNEACHPLLFPDLPASTSFPVFLHILSKGEAT